MSQIDEWNPVLPRIGASSAPPAAAAGEPIARAQRPVVRTPKLVDEIYNALMARRPPPAAVHFYLGEGLRWIRVGFEGDQPLTPVAVGDVGRAIKSCVAAQPLYFHALRPHDMLFFLEGGGGDSIGMPAKCFGTPLDQVLRAWGMDPPAAATKASPRRPGHSRAAASYSHLAKAKP